MKQEQIIALCLHPDNLSIQNFRCDEGLSLKLLSYIGNNIAIVCLNAINSKKKTKSRYEPKLIQGVNRERLSVLASSSFPSPHFFFHANDELCDGN